MEKKLFTVVIVLALALASCINASQKTDAGNTGINSNQKSKEMTTTTLKKTIQLSRADFLSKVANFEENPDQWVYLGDKPCIIDFYADWCGPCKIIAPILEELAQEYDGEIYIYKIDTERETQLATEFGIRSIPTLLFCPMGKEPQMAQGALPKDAFKQVIEEVLLKKS